MSCRSHCVHTHRDTPGHRQGQQSHCSSGGQNPPIGSSSVAVTTRNGSVPLRDLGFDGEDRAQQRRAETSVLEDVEEDRRPEHRLLAHGEPSWADPGSARGRRGPPRTSRRARSSRHSGQISVAASDTVHRAQQLEIDRAETRPDRAALVVGQEVAGHPDLALGPACGLIPEWIRIAEPDAHRGTPRPRRPLMRSAITPV